MKRREFLNSKSKWLTQNDFKRVFGKNTNQLPPMAGIVVNGSSYEKSPTRHNFRELNKEKWIDKKSFRF